MLEEGSRRRPTMVDVAREAGVSLKTVSRVINAETTVNEPMTKKVLETAAAMGFRRNDVARNLRAIGNRSATIGLVFEDIANPFYSLIAAGAADVALDRNALLFTASSEGDADREKQLLLAMFNRRVDGVLMVPTPADHAYLRPEIAMGTPVVCLDRPARGVSLDSVVIDNRRGVREVVATLIARGHTRIGLLAESLKIHTMRTRVAAARTSLEEAGLSTDGSLLRAGLHTPSATAEAIRELLALPNPPTAVLCMNNRNTIGALQELERVGSDLDVAGFDDFETSHLMPRPLTLVKYDARSLGRRAAELLFDRIDGDRSARRRVVIPTELSKVGTRV